MATQPNGSARMIVQRGYSTARGSKRSPTMIVGCTVAALLTTFGVVCAPALGQTGEPKKDAHLPAKVRAAWENAGFQYGWKGEGIGFFDFSPDSDKAPHGDLPFFHTREWKMGVIGRLPPPEQPFGLDLMDLECTEAILKEITRLKTLQRLYLDTPQLAAPIVGLLPALENLEGLTLLRGKLTNDGLKQLAAMKSLRTLCLLETDVTKTDLGLLRNVQALLLVTNVDDAGIIQLAGLENLQELRLSLNLTTEAHFKLLARLQQVRKLNLSYNTKLTDEALKNLLGLKDLRSLDISKTEMTDAGLKSLTALKDLHELHLRGTGVTDDGLNHVAAFHKLRVLDLSNTWVSDRGVKHLHELKDLQFLDLARTEVSDRGVAELLKVLPKLKVNRIWRQPANGSAG